MHATARRPLWVRVGAGLLATVLFLTNTVYPWISLLPAPPIVVAQEESQIATTSAEATPAASVATPAPTPLDPLDNLDSLLLPSSPSAEIVIPEESPETSPSASTTPTPEPTPETQSSTPSATQEPTTTQTPTSSTPSPTNTPTPTNTTTNPAESPTLSTTPLPPLLSPFTIHLSYPFNGTYPVSYSFGETSGSSYVRLMQNLFNVEAHDGIDFATPENTQILATDNGTITLAGPGPYGQTVVIKHSWGNSYYGHLAQTSVSVGDVVTTGQIIGLSGNTGVSTGPHLHFGIRPNHHDPYNGYRGMIDPLPYLNGQVLGTINHKHELVHLPYKTLKSTDESLSIPIVSTESGVLTYRLINPQGESKLVYPSIYNYGTGDTAILPRPNPFIPGEYQLVVTDRDGSSDVIKFSWGVLTLNTNQSDYLLGQKSALSFAVLDEVGEMVCDADLILTITNPSGKVDLLSTSNNGIARNTTVCQSKDLTLTPDYESSYLPSEIGTYSLSLTAITGKHTFTTTDNFTVAKSLPFTIERKTATRIFPGNIYPVILKITAYENISSKIKEFTPTSFNTTPANQDALSPWLDPDALSLMSDQSYTRTELGLTQELAWDLNLEKDESTILGYTYDAPDESPAIYQLGPISFADRSESRSWNIAIDSVDPTVGYFSPRFQAEAGDANLLLRQPNPNNGDLMVATIAIRPSASTVNTPTGWTLLDSQTGTDGAAEGADTGSVSTYVFYKVADGTEGTADQTFTETGTTSIWIGSIAKYRSSTGTYDLSSGGYSINADATNWNGTLDADIGVKTGDIVSIIGAQNGDLSNTSAWDVSATGVNVKATVIEHSEMTTATGNDLELGIAAVNIWEGNNTTTPTITLTQSVAASGAVIAYRVRQGSGTNRTDTWLRSMSARSSGTTSLSITYANHDIGDLLIIMVSSRGTGDPTPTTPTGWTALGSSYNGGVGALGIDAGNARITGFYREASSRLTGTVTVTITGGNVSAGAMMSVRKDDIGSWTIDTDGGTDTSAGTAWSVTGSGIDLNAGDLVIIGSSINSDGYTYSGYGLTATGSTLATTTEDSEIRTATGNDGAYTISSTSVSSGSSTGAPTFTMTASGTAGSAPAGASLIVKVLGNTNTLSNKAVGFFTPPATWTAAGDANLSLAYPDPRSGDLMLAITAIRPAASTVNTPSGWTLVDSRTGTDGGAEAADTGSVGIYVFSKTADGSEGTGTLAFTETGTTSVWIGNIMKLRSGTGTYSVSGSGYSLNADTATWGGTLGADIGLTNGDVFLLAAAQNGDLSNTSAWDFNATGINQKNTIYEHGEFGSTTGNDIEVGLASGIIWDGTNTATPTTTITQSAAASGVVSAIRIREDTGTQRTDTWVRSAGPQVVTTTTSLALPYPEHEAGDLFVLFVASRGTTDPTVATPEGWTSLGSYNGGAGTFGVDAGNARVTAFYREATSRRWGTQTLILSAADVAIGQMVVLHTKNIDTWTIDSDGGTDTSAGASWSTTGSGIDLSSSEGGDVILVGNSINTDAYTYSSHALSASGITFGETTQTATYNTTSGNDANLNIVTSRVTGGAASIAPTLTMTASGSTANAPAGSSIFVKVVGLPTVVQASGTANANNGATVKIALGNSVQAQTTTISSGTWTITDIARPSAGTVVTVWVDNVADNLESTAVTIYNSAPITGLTLNTNTLSLGSNQNQSISLTNLNSYDCTEDEDVMHQAVSSHLKVEGDSCAGSTTNSYSSETLSILSGDTLALGTSETITSYDLDNAGTITVTGNGTINVSHDWANTGTYTAGTSTVNLTGGDSTTQTISGDTTFYNLTSTTTSNSAGRTIRFTAGTTTTVTGTWTATGANSKILTLESSTTSPWIIMPTVASVSYVSVSYSTNQGFDFCATNTTDGGNNTRWRTTCEPSAQSFQRKTFYDDQNARYWRFSTDGTDIDAEYSSDGTSWNASSTLPYSTNDFSVEYKSISGTEYVIVAVASSNDIIVRRGTLSASSVTWDGTSSIALNGTSGNDSYSYPTIALNSSNSLWVGARYYNGSNYIYTTNTTSYISSTITHEETETGSADDPATSVTTDANLTAATGHLYLASIGMKMNVSVTSVTGLGLTWSLLDAQCSGRGQSRAEIWYAQGTPSGDGTVTANISTGVEDSVIAVSRYSGVSTVDALGALVSINSNGIDGACTAGSDANEYTTTLTTTKDNSIIYSAASLRQESHTPGNSYTERADRNSTNVTVGSRAGLGVQDKSVSSISNVIVNGSTTSLATTDYAVVATEILPLINTYTLDQSVSTWVWGSSPYQLGSSSPTSLMYGSLAPQSSDNMYVVMRSSTSILGCTWIASEGNWENSSGSNCEGVSGGSWYNDSWNYRLKLTIDATKVDADLTDYPVYVNLNNLPSSFHTNVNQTDARDIRITKSDGTTELPREVVYYTSASDTGELHFKYTGTLSGTDNTDVYLYYGNAGASDYSSTDTYGRNNVWTGYHSVWHLQETSGSGAYIIDSTGNGHDATPTNTTSTSGKMGNGRSFDGNGDFLTVASPSLPTGDYTYESWGYRNSTTIDHTIFMSSDGAAANEVLLAVVNATDPTNPDSLRYTADGTSAYGATNVSTGIWQALSMTRATATTTGFINGVAEGVTGNDGTALNFSTCDLYIGQDVDTGCSGDPYDWWDGYLDELRISSTARSSTWMSTVYKNQNNPGTFFGSFGTQEQKPYNSDSIDTTTTAISDNLTLLSDGNNLHLAYVDDETTDQISYRKYSSGSWSAATLVADATSNDDAYPTISLDTTNSDLYILWIDGATSDVIYSSCDTTTGCDAASEWSTEITHDSTGSNVQLSSNISAAGKIFFVYSDGTTLVWDDITIGGSNTAPNSPTSLLQKTTGDVTLSTGTWHNSTSIKFTATATDTDNPDTLQLCIEIDQLGTSFSNTEDSCGTGVSYTGSGVTITHTITVTDAQEYHWQARVKDLGGLYSSWVSYDVNAESARDVGVDTTAPTGGTVYDGTSVGVDTAFATSSLSSLSANWSSFNSDVSGLARYDYSIGTTAGATDIKAWTDNSTTTNVTATGLTLQTSQMYYINVRAVDNAGNVQSAVSSNGQLVAPSISFAITPASTTFSNLSAGNGYTDTETTTLTTSTNAYNGYVIRAFTTDLLKSVGGTHQIENFSAGSYASPASWSGSETGFGYTSSDTSIQGLDKFAGGTLYAPFSQTGPGDIVADHTSTVAGTSISNEAFNITYKVKVPASQAATNYTSTVVYTATAQY